MKYGFRPSGLPPGSILGQSLGRKPYFMVRPSSLQRIATISRTSNVVALKWFADDREVPLAVNKGTQQIQNSNGWFQAFPKCHTKLLSQGLSIIGGSHIIVFATPWGCLGNKYGPYYQVTDLKFDIYPPTLLLQEQRCRWLGSKSGIWFATCIFMIFNDCDNMYVMHRSPPEYKKNQALFECAPQVHGNNN